MGAMKQVLVVGYGVSGKSCIALLQKLKISCVAVDKNPDTGALLDSPEFPLDNISQVIVSPGIPPSHPIVQRASQMGIEVIGEMEFAMRHTSNRCVGITGSNGKTTTTLLTVHALNFAGVKAKAVGNVGHALSNYLLNPDLEDLLIIELSSFQLETLSEKKLELAVYLNLTPNHLDRYPSMTEYAAAKAKIQDCLRPEGHLLVSSQVWSECQATLKNEKVEVFDAEQDFLAAIFEEEYIQLPRQNVCAAIRICEHFGVSKELFIASLKSFKAPPHRVEWVAEVNGVCYYNDSKATSVEAVMHAISLFRGPLILIIGGVDKKAPYQPWIEAFRGKVKHLVAFGAASSIMEKELASYYSFERVDTLEEAVAKAGQMASPGDTVILSPGCSSYDQFKSYEHRGDAFKKLVQKEVASDKH